MIHSKPKSSSILSISLFIVGSLTVALWLFVELVQNPASYFWMKLILAPTLLVIGIIVAIKGLFSAVSVTLGSNRLSYRYPLGAQRQHKITDVTDWHEEVVKSKSGVYKQLTIQLSNGKKLKLSNQENSDYEKVIGYLKKKKKT